MTREGNESTWEPVRYGKFASQFHPDIKTTIRQFERIETKIYSQLSIIFNQIYLNEEMLPKFTHTQTYTHTRTHVI